jgi:Ca2+-binding EF-hand superfamily protein
MSSSVTAQQRRRLAREESAIQLQDEQVNELKEAFEFFNKSGSGSIDKTDLKAVCAELGLPADAAAVNDLMKVNRFESK